MKKLLTLISSLYGGGAEKLTADLSFEFSEKFDSTILTFIPYSKTYNYAGKLINLGATSKKNIFGKIIKQLKTIRSIRKFKSKYKPDITLSHMGISNIHNIYTKYKDKTICVLHGRNSYYHSNKMVRIIYKKIYTKADCIVCVSKYIKEDFENIYNISTPIVVITNGINNKLIRKKAKEKIVFKLPDEYIVYVGGFRREKCHIQLIESLSEFLKNNSLHLVFVGDGLLREEIINKIKELELQDKIHLVGNIPNPYPIIKKAKLSLVASRTESFSLVLVESLSLGIPVISTDCGGPKEIIEPDMNIDITYPHITDYGILLKNWYKDEINNDFADAINMLLNNEELYKSMKIKGVDRADFFDINKTKKKYVDLLNQL